MSCKKAATQLKMLSRFDNLRKITNDLNPILLNEIREKIHLYSIGVQIEYQTWRGIEYEMENEHWLDELENNAA